MGMMEEVNDQRSLALRRIEIDDRIRQNFPFAKIVIEQGGGVLTIEATPCTVRESVRYPNVAETEEMIARLIADYARLEASYLAASKK